jgi:replicative DNA helicase
MSNRPKWDKKEVGLTVRNLSDSLGKLPPQAIDLEQTIIGALILQPRSMHDVAGFLRPEHFYEEKHKVIYFALIEMYAGDEPIDMRTVTQHLKKKGKLELIGGPYAIVEITAGVHSADNLEYHARILVEHWVKRQSIMVAGEIQVRGFDDMTDAFDVVNRGLMALQSILDGVTVAASDNPPAVVLAQLLNDIQERANGKVDGLSSGFGELDKLTNGLHNTDLIILAARPGMGKTAFALAMALINALLGNAIGFLSLEMSVKQLWERLVSSETEIEADKIRRGQMAPHEWTKLSNMIGKLSTLPLYIDDTPYMNIIDVRSRAIRMKHRHNIKALFVDYLQLMKGMGTENNREQEIATISRNLKGLAKELNIPIIALGQLSRGVETRGGDKRPHLSDLRESGAIEQDADIVIFLYRAEYYKITVDEDGMPTHGICEAIVAKQRHGSTGTAKVKFVGKYTKFMNLEDTPLYRPFDTTGYKSVLPDEDRGSFISMDEARDRELERQRKIAEEKKDDTPF